MHQVIAHIDMDCFFAACEEKQNPELKNKPLIIGSLPTDNRGVVSTANYEARKYGVHSALPISTAFKLCPQGIYKRGNFELYKRESKQVMSILKSFSPLFKQVSVDEAYVDITEFSKSFKSLDDAGNAIKNIIHELTGLTCSVGIAESKYVAKIASDYKKPNGVTVVTVPENFLAESYVSVIPGCGKVLTKKLNNKNIFTCAQLAKYDRVALIDTFGRYIIHFQDLVQGKNKSGISMEERQTKSMSKEMTFQDDISIIDCKQYIEPITEKLHAHLGDYSFKTVSIKIRYPNFTTFTRDQSLTLQLKSKDKIKETVKELLKEFKPDQKVRLFGIKVSNLKEELHYQTTLAEFSC